MDVHGAGDRAHRPGTDAQRADRLQRLLTQARVRRQSKIVVGGEIDDLAMIERALMALLAFEDPELAVETLLLEAVEFA